MFAYVETANNKNLYTIATTQKYHTQSQTWWQHEHRHYNFIANMNDTLDKNIESLVIDHTLRVQHYNLY
jgi:hypothetical protein